MAAYQAAQGLEAWVHRLVGAEGRVLTGINGVDDGDWVALTDEPGFIIKIFKGKPVVTEALR